MTSDNIVVRDMTNIMAFSLEGFWMYTLSIPIPDFISLKACYGVGPKGPPPEPTVQLSP